MLIHANAKSLRGTSATEYAARFLFGGLMTVVAGLIAAKFGPAVGGLFLAFPAIFPASATLVEKHERKRKRDRGLNGWRRGTDAASADADGAALGAIGLAVFAAILFRQLPDGNALVWLTIALTAWAGVNALCWFAWKKRRRLRRAFSSRTTP